MGLEPRTLELKVWSANRETILASTQVSLVLVQKFSFRWKICVHKYKLHNLLYFDAEVSRWGGGIADNHLPLTSVCLCFLNAAHKSSKDENQSSAVCLILTKIKTTFFCQRILFPK